LIFSLPDFFPCPFIHNNCTVQVHNMFPSTQTALYSRRSVHCGCCTRACLELSVSAPVL
jgi:hypothetical protein